MKTFGRNLRRLGATIGLAAALAALAIPTALAGTPSTLRDGRSPDTRDAAVQARLALVDGRSPDTIDAAIAAQAPVATATKPSGFAWDDFGMGVAATSGAFLLALAFAIGVPAARSHREVARSTASV